MCHRILRKDACELWVSGDWEGSRCGLFQGNILKLTWNEKQNHEIRQSWLSSLVVFRIRYFPKSIQPYCRWNALCAEMWMQIVINAWSIGEWITTMLLTDLRMKMFAFLPRERKAILDGRLLCISRHIYWPAASWPTRDPKKRAGHGSFLLADIELRGRFSVWGSQSAEDTMFLRILIKQDRRTNNVTFRRICGTIAAVGKQYVLHILSVCL